MKKMLPLLVVGILVLSGLGAVAGTEGEKENLISETIFFSEPIINEMQDYVSIELAESNSDTMQTNKPLLPIVSNVYKFPFGTRIDNVEVTFSDKIVQEISKPIEPAPETLPVSINAIHQVVKSDEILTYEDIDIYPEQRYSYSVKSGLDNGVRTVFLSVPINPVQYNPQEGTILYSLNAQIDITYSEPDNPVTFPRDYDLLILTPTQFESALQPLVDHKNQIGINTILVTLDDIPSGVGIDEQEDIKYYIKDAIETMGITYVLLVGSGVEGEELFPVRHAWISDDIEDYFPSDLYYADVYDGYGGFPDWDTDNDGRYSEYPVDIDSMDVIPDVYLGRLAATNVGQVNDVVAKIIEYKAHNYMSGKILQAGGDTFIGNSQMEGEYANTKVLEKLPGYTPIQCWGSTDTLTKPNIRDGWKNVVDFVDFSGHGSWASWATHPPNDDDTWIPPKTLISQYTGWIYLDFDFYMINNGYKFPVVFYNSCSNNNFMKSPNVFGWYTVARQNGGGIAVYAASGIGYGVPGNEVSRRMGWMEVNCFDELYTNKDLGITWHNCISEYYAAFDGDLDKIDYKTMVEFCLIGDPTVVAENGDDPQSRSVDRPILTNILERLAELFPRITQLLQQILAQLA